MVLRIFVLKLCRLSSKEYPFEDIYYIFVG